MRRLQSSDLHFTKRHAPQTAPRLFLATLAIASVLLLPAAASGRLLGPELQPLPKPLNPRLSTALDRLVQLHETKGRDEAIEFAEHRGLELSEDRVAVTVLPEHGRESDSIDLAAARSLGARVRIQSRHLVDLDVPVARLNDLASVEGVGMVRSLMRGYPADGGATAQRSFAPSTHPGGIGPHRLEAPANRRERDRVVSEGVALSGADVLHGQGHDGSGKTVAVIDLGFNGVLDALYAGETPDSMIYWDFAGIGIESGTEHGTACLENVYDMAPGAEICLMITNSVTTLEAAAETCAARGFDIVSHSVIYYDWPLDGRGLPCDAAEGFYDSGGLWFNGAGNHAYDHEEGTYTDENGDGWHEFIPGVDDALKVHLNAGETIFMSLFWEGYPSTYNDYDLYLMDDSLIPVATSLNWQNPAPPREWFNYTVPTTGDYHIMVHNFAAADSCEYDLFCSGFRRFSVGKGGDGIYDLCGSVLSPADAEHAVAVGALHREDWLTGPIASFSSRGPTNDGRLKPEIAGPDSCSGYTWSIWTGTSSAAPHVAGAAALVWEAAPGLVTNDDVRAHLLDTAIDMGDPGPDNTYGHGRLHVTDDTPVDVSFYGVAGGSESVTLRWTLTALPDDDGLVIDRTAEGGPTVRLTETPLELSSPGSFEDDTVWPGETFRYTLSSVKTDGTEEKVATSRPIHVPGTSTLALSTAAPNPVREGCALAYHLPERGYTRLAIYDVSGRMVRELVDGMRDAGPGSVLWDGRDGAGQQVASGIYLARIEHGGAVRTGKLLVVR
ncbi:MAG: S8 family serine peptidase [Candidatus Eisenbacteria bacterium]|nr:S8 family serine peptidase [Candidatus Eisenbacteria bacterium]